MRMVFQSQFSLTRCQQTSEFNAATLSKLVDTCNEAENLEGSNTSQLRIKPWGLAWLRRIRNQAAERRNVWISGM